MADFFSNLLVRSSSQLSTAVLQPRLPGLFEARQGADEFLTPQADRSIYKSSHSPAALQEQDATGILQPAAMQAQVNPEKETGKPTAISAPEQPLLPTQIRQARALSGASDKSLRTLQDRLPVHRQAAMSLKPERTIQENAFNAGLTLETENTAAQESSSRSQAGPGLVGAQQVLSYRRNVEANTAGRVLKSAASFIQPAVETPSSRQAESLPSRIAPGAILSAEPAVPFGHDIVPVRYIETENVPERENGDPPRPGTGPVNAWQATGQVLKSATSLIEQEAAETSSSRQAESLSSKTEHSAEASILEAHPTELHRPSFGLATLSAQPIPASLQLPREPETVVQVHIGRIEVRAVTPPTLPQPTPAPRPQPKMSLDDYLRQREAKQ